MTSFEMLYDKLEKLICNELYDYIIEVNEEHNDGIILPPLNKKETNQKPFFEINFEKAEHNEKEILIECNTYYLSIDISLNNQDKDYKRKLWRYFEAFENIVKNNQKNDLWNDFVILNYSKNQIRIKNIL